MLHSRLRPAARGNPTAASHTRPTALAPEFDDANESSDPEESQEDLFSAFLPHLFPDDAPSFHGDPGQRLIYTSPRYGELEIMVPSYPGQTRDNSEKGTNGPEKKDEGNQAEEGRKLFAHILWSAGMVVAEGVENADCKAMENVSAAQKEACEVWSVQGETVLELGAGAALPSLICALANASLVVATDHPSSSALSGAIDFNVRQNVLRHQTSHQTTTSIQPHEWGTLTDSFSQSHRGAFTRVIAADCFWMRSQHENLARTMQWFLAPGGRVWCVGSFHTGRAIVAGFFETALENGFEMEQIFERDLVDRDEQGREIRREWVPQREGEGPENRQRWCVIAVLKRREEYWRDLG
ncbi:hypothetical protein N7462_008612 [Penicillium macrosclerotiorum]|uniref:uncharacterized protein n=1 Tax=Penicillium macrosclerotiorum TaxID=303699 RepID=UPI00254985BE|nr:uncharacterized protein N7462_008612 [Penicillium macrosclerotiorum]KAJ5675715.1 hypothetical protein N7462_008612 [Penicillium macrosclerotiorum]